MYWSLREISDLQYCDMCNKIIMIMIYNNTL